MTAENENTQQLKAMGLMEHLDELRARVVRSLLAIIVLFLIAFSFAEYIVNYINYHYRRCYQREMRFFTSLALWTTF